MKIKKAVSPLVSTVLLIMIVIVMALIIIWWARFFVKETIEKDIAGNLKRVEDYCKEVQLRSIINNDGSFGFENIGNVPVYGFSLKVTEKGAGKSDTISASGTVAQVNPGSGVVLDSTIDPNILPYSAYEEVKIIPILLGKTDGGAQEFTCPEENALVI
ncbi:MAG: archaellin/type IV pilin N-terminal domain-containing protein [Nanoarchaeota archaeon]